jgi:glycerate dehydrogenase
VLVHRRTKTSDEPGVKQVDLNTLVRESDVISLHCPLSPDNAKMVNAELLSKMKRTAFLINTARGGLVNEAELAQALNAGHIAGAALDVLTREPPDANNPLIGAKNCLITPHIAWASRPARQRLLQVTAENIRAFQQRHPQNVVNP